MERDLGALRLPRWGRVAAGDDVVSWTVLDPAGERVEPIAGFLRDLVARDASAATVRSYSYDLLRWWRWLRVVGVEWDRASSAEVRELVLWLQQARKPIAAARRASMSTAGTINPVTRKQHPGDGYGARTVRHSNAVLRAFYEYWIAQDAGPVLNPVPREREWGGTRANAHHNPLEPFAPRGRLRYNPRLPKQRPRTIPDQQWAALFAAMRSDRDRAILAMAVSSGARAGELLGIRGGDLDWGEQLIRVHRKGTRAEQWLPVSAESFVWLRLYLDQIDGVGMDEPVWQTLRRRSPVIDPGQAARSATAGAGSSTRPGPGGGDGSALESAGGRGGSNAASGAAVAMGPSTSAGPVPCQDHAIEHPPVGSVPAAPTGLSPRSPVLLPAGLVRRPLTYDALRAVLRRANAVLGANWSMHDLRHTCALRMVRDQALSLRDVQVMLGHAHLATTQLYLQDDDHAVIGRVQAHLATLRAARGQPGPPRDVETVDTPVVVALGSGGYAPEDMAVLFPSAAGASVSAASIPPAPPPFPTGSGGGRREGGET